MTGYVVIYGVVMGDRTVSEKVGRSQIPYRHHMVRKTIYNPYINIRLHL